jgi:hypothetical protein
VAKWHWVTSTNAYWRDDVKTEKSFLKAFASMKKQYESDGVKSVKRKYKSPAIGADWESTGGDPWDSLRV